MRRLALTSFLVFVASIALPQSIRGRVVSVSDGDTIGILVSKGGKQLRQTVRLEGIDAPESDQPFGKASKQFLSTMVFRRVVDVKVTGKDKYGRTLGFVKIGGLDVNHTMVKSGMAWWYRQYAPGNKTLKAAEDHARSKKGGLWAAKSMAPWEWRHGGKVKEFLAGLKRKKNG